MEWTLSAGRRLLEVGGIQGGIAVLYTSCPALSALSMSPLEFFDVIFAGLKAFASAVPSFCCS